MASRARFQHIAARLAGVGAASLELSIPLLSVSTASDEDLDLTALESFIWAETA